MRGAWVQNLSRSLPEMRFQMSRFTSPRPGGGRIIFCLDPGSHVRRTVGDMLRCPPRLRPRLECEPSGHTD